MQRQPQPEEAGTIRHCVSVHVPYNIAGNFRGVKYSLFSWASWPLRNFYIGVAYPNVGMQASNETKRNFYSRKSLFL